MAISGGNVYAGGLGGSGGGLDPRIPEDFGNIKLTLIDLEPRTGRQGRSLCR